MNKKALLYLLAGCSLLLPVAVYPDEKPQTAEKPQPEENISAEDLQVIAHLELLEKMDMLKDFQILSAGEEAQ